MIKDMFREAVNPLDQPVMAKSDFGSAAAGLSSMAINNNPILGFDAENAPAIG